MTNTINVRRVPPKFRRYNDPCAGYYDKHINPNVCRSYVDVLYWHPIKKFAVYGCINCNSPTPSEQRRHIAKGFQVVRRTRLLHRYY